MTGKERIKQFEDCKEFLKKFVGCTVICYVGKENNALAIRTVFNHYKLVDYGKIGFELKKNDDETLFIHYYFGKVNHTHLSVAVTV